MRNYKFFEVRGAVESAAHKLCALLDLPVVTVTWSGDTSTACINELGDIYLADRLDSDIVTHSLLARYVGFVVHELLHRKYTDFKVRGKGQYIQQLHNAVEDIWIERQAVKAGLTGNIANLMTDLIDQMVDEALKDVTDWSDPAQYPFVLAVWGRRYASKKVPVANGLEPVFTEASRRIDGAKSSAGTLAIAEWVMDQLKGIKPEPKQPPTKPGEEGDQPGEPGESGETGDQPGEGGKSGETGDQPGEGGKSGEQGEGGDDGQPGEAGDARSPEEDGKVVQAREVHAKIEGTGGTGGSYSGGSLGKPGEHLIGGDGSLETGKANPRLAYDIKRMFEATGIDEWSMGRKSGALDTGALASTRTGNVNVFKQRKEEDGVDSAVVVCIDVSGSMGRARMDAAKAITTALLKALGMAGTATAVLTFGSETSVVKGFDSNYKLGIRAANRMDSVGGGTDDAFCLRYAHEMLAKRDESRKVCFFVTDGCGYVEMMMNQVKVGNKLGITSVGVGIGTSVNHIFGADRSVLVKSLDTMTNASFAKIKLVA